MSKIKDLPALERPREKALRYGISSLSDPELLAILIGSGYQGTNATEVTTNILSKTCGLYGLSFKTLEELKKFKGIKTKKCLILASVFEIHKRLAKRELESQENEITNDYLYYKYKSELSVLEQEVLILIIVNSKNKAIYESTLYKGSNSAIVFSSKDVIREILTHKGKGFYLIHNHPNGNAVASNEDIQFTMDILRESKKFRIPLIDHIIIGDSEYCSIMKFLTAS